MSNIALKSANPSVTTAATYSNTGGGDSLTKVNDGVISYATTTAAGKNVWTNWVATPRDADTITFDFGSSRTVSSAKVYVYSDPSAPAPASIVPQYLQADGTTWANVPNVTASPAAPAAQANTFTFPAIATAKLRFVMTAGIVSGSTKGSIGITEIEIFGGVATLPVRISTITVNGTADTITEKGGSLQLGATIAPAVLAESDVSWAVENVDSDNDGVLAEIDDDGLLTALHDGAVRVVATSTDDWNVVATRIVTLSNQDPDVTAPTWADEAGVTVTATGTDGITSSWPAASDDREVVAYGVTVYPTGNPEEAVTETVSGRSFSRPGLSEDTEYTVEVRPVDGAGNRGTAISGSARTEATPPVEVEPIATEVELTASVTRQTYGTATPVVLTAEVSGGDGSLVGSVDFYRGVTRLATVELTGTTASYAILATTSPGSFSYTARFVSSEEASLSSESEVVGVIVERATTATKLALSDRSLSATQKPRATISVTTNSTVAPVGKLSIYDGSKVIRTVNLYASAKGKVILDLARLSTGSHKLKVTFQGSATAAASTSSVVTVSVAKAVSTARLTVSDKTLTTAQKPKLSISVSTSTKVAATGKVAIYDGSKLVKTVTLHSANKGKLKLSLPKLKKGTHKLSVRYLGSSQAAADTSPRVTVKVRK